MIKFAQYIFKRPSVSSKNFLDVRSVGWMNKMFASNQAELPNWQNQKRLRISLDFYRSEDFGYSFLEMPTKEADAARVKDALKDLEVIMKVDKAMVDKIGRGYENFKMVLETNTNNVRSLLDSNITKYEQLIEKSRDDEVLQDVSALYVEIQGILRQLLDKKSLEERIDINILGPISSLLVQLSIVDLSLWKNLIYCTFLTPEKFTDDNQLTLALSNIKFFLRRFYFIESDEQSFSRFHFSFKESEMSSLLNKNLVSSFFLKFDRHFIGQHETRLRNKNNLCTILSLACDIIYKLGKVSYVNNFEDRKALKKFEKVLLDNLDDLTPVNCLTIFSNYVNLGINNKEFVEKFTNHFLSLTSEIQMREFLESLIKAWKNNGKMDEELYEKSVKKILKNFIRTSKELSKFPGLAFELLMLKFNDTEVWNMLIKRISEYRFQDLYLFQKKSLHLVFQHLRSQNEFEVNLEPTRHLEDLLSKFCIGQQIGKNIFEISIPEIENSRIDCCNHTTIEQYRSVINKKIEKLSPHQKKKYLLTEQTYPETLQENLIKAAIEAHFPKFLKKPIKISQEHPHCLYKIDLALKIPDVHDKIALEVSGLAYTFESGEFLNKKQTKFNFLRNHGWLPIIINIGEKISHHKMAVASPLTLEPLAREVYEIMRKDIQSQLNIELPEVKISKWMTSGNLKKKSEETAAKPEDPAKKQSSKKLVSFADLNL